MTKNQNGKKIEDRGKILLDTTNQYIKNEKSKNESEKILNIVGEKLKSRIKSFTKKVKDMTKALTPNLIIKKRVLFMHIIVLKNKSKDGPLVSDHAYTPISFLD